MKKETITESGQSVHCGADSIIGSARLLILSLIPFHSNFELMLDERTDFVYILGQLSTLYILLSADSLRG